MRVERITTNINKQPYLKASQNPERSTLPAQTSNASINNYMSYNAMVNRATLSFKGYHGDQQPTKKLFWILTGRNTLYTDNYTNERLYNAGNSGWKKWSSLKPNDALHRTPEQAIQSICTLSGKNYIPDYIPTPNYGNNWGRHATYIEINPRLIAKHENGTTSEGLLNTMKLLPILPVSADKSANCIILSQLYPCFWQDAEGKDGFGSLYTVDLHSGISKNLTSRDLSRDGERMGDDELVRAFNDFAHLRGMKTGIRMPLAAGQITHQRNPFDWNTGKDAYIDACCWAIELGFDAIYFDSAKHVGGYDMGNYHGNGDLPTYKDMQDILYQIRHKTGRHDIAFIGEKCTSDSRFKDMGLTAGTDWGNPSDRRSILHNSAQARHCNEYAAGPDISNDNDRGGHSFDNRFYRIANALFAYENQHDKLPIFMQMTDLFPLNPNINTHQQMLHSMTLGDNAHSHIDNIFNNSNDAFTYQNDVYELFKNSLYL